MRRTAEEVKTKVDPWLVVKISGFYGFFSTLLLLSLRDVIPIMYAAPLVAMVLGPIIYFLFVRGTPNGWKKDKSPWTFASYMSLVALAAAAYGVFALLMCRLVEQ